MCDSSRLKLNLSQCSSNDIVVSVVEIIRGEQVTLELCRRCWEKVADKDKFYGKVELKKPKKRKV